MGQFRHDIKKNRTKKKADGVGNTLFAPEIENHVVDRVMYMQAVRCDDIVCYINPFNHKDIVIMSSSTVCKDHINSSKKVWKSEFDQELLSYLNNNRRMLGIIREIVKLSVKLYPTCYDYDLHGGAVLWNVG